MNIALIGNKETGLRNNSRLIDSCDLVVRVNKMCNLDTGLTGKRTDWLITTLYRDLWTHSRERRHADLIPKLDRVFVDMTRFNELRPEERAEVLSWKPLGIPTEMRKKCFCWTTSALGLYMLYSLFPHAHIYFAGQDAPNTWLQTRNASAMQKGYELPFFKALEAQGVVEFLDEEQF
jgi:hypothetical protein